MNILRSIMQKFIFIFLKKKKKKKDDSPERDRRESTKLSPKNTSYKITSLRYIYERMWDIIYKNKFRRGR
jgi:hypothetical protein